MFIGHFAAGFASILGPPPLSPHAIAVLALALWLIPLWARWIGRLRGVTLP